MSCLPFPGITQLHPFTAHATKAVHDFAHGGLTNDFLIATQDPLAVLYNDRCACQPSVVGKVPLLVMWAGRLQAWYGSTVVAATLSIKRVAAASWQWII